MTSNCKKLKEEKEAWKKWCNSKELKDYCMWEAFMSLQPKRKPVNIVSSESFRVVSKKPNIVELRR